jgi:hypothetical protein
MYIKQNSLNEKINFLLQIYLFGLNEIKFLIFHLPFESF